MLLNYKLIPFLLLISLCLFSVSSQANISSYQSKTRAIITNIEHDEIDSVVKARSAIRDLKNLINEVKKSSIILNRNDMYETIINKYGPSWKTLTLAELDNDWLNGKRLKDLGVKYDEIDHFSAGISSVDIYLHTYAAIEVLKGYIKTKDRYSLQRVIDELNEANMHADALG